MSEPLKGTESAANAIARVSYSHDALIDMMITNPMLSQRQLAEAFGYTQPWVSRIMNSDAFLARLALRKEDLVDPVLAASIDEKLRNLASISLDIVMDKLNTSRNPDLAMKAMEVATKAMGYGAKQQSGVTIQQSFVVALPEKSATEADWAAKYGKTVEVVPGG